MIFNKFSFCKSSFCFVILLNNRKLLPLQVAFTFVEMKFSQLKFLQLQTKYQISCFLQFILYFNRLHQKIQCLVQQWHFRLYSLNTATVSWQTKHTCLTLKSCLSVHYFWQKRKSCLEFFALRIAWKNFWVKFVSVKWSFFPSHIADFSTGTKFYWIVRSSYGF